MSEAINDNGAQFPMQRYTLQVMEYEAKISASSGNPMVVLDWEVVAPEDVEIVTKENGEIIRNRYICAGLKCRNYLMLGGKAIGRTVKLLKKLGIEIEGFDPGMGEEAINLDWSPLKGLTVQAKGGSKIKPMTEEYFDEVTGDKKNRNMLDEDGKAITSFQFEFNLDDIIKRVEA